MNFLVSAPSPAMELPLPEDMLLSMLAAPAYKTVLVVDLVASVRLMGEDERGIVARWQRFLRVAHQVIPGNTGRLVKSLGDGLLAEFEESRDALRVAQHLHHHFELDNASRPPQQHMLLRAGIHSTHRYADAHDIYGHGVNLAARIAGLAHPGGTVVTRCVRETLIDGLDGFMHDMGESYLKHWPEAVRTWSVHGPQTSPPADRSLEREIGYRPCLAVLPFQARPVSANQVGMGDLIADGLIAQLASNPSLRVISRLSTNPVTPIQSPSDRITTRSNARFVLSGSYATRGEKVILMAELTDTGLGEVIWAQRFGGESLDLMEVNSILLRDLSQACVPVLLRLHGAPPNGSIPNATAAPSGAAPRRTSMALVPSPETTTAACGKSRKRMERRLTDKQARGEEITPGVCAPAVAPHQRAGRGLSSVIQRSSTAM